MSYGVIGKYPNQKFNNSGIYTPNDVTELINNKQWGGKLEHIETIEITTSQDNDFLNLKEDIYKHHIFFLTGVTTNAGGSERIRVRFSNNGGTSYYAGGTDYSWSSLKVLSSGTATSHRDADDNQIQTFQTNDTEYANGFIKVSGAGDPNSKTYVSFHGVMYGDEDMSFGGGCNEIPTIINAIKIFTPTPTDAGTIKLYGYKL
tara:strand:+ start:944 stop:1552 length:609 start_codon:yes stop_codon:yes gene_type:complete